MRILKEGKKENKPKTWRGKCAVCETEIEATAPDILHDPLEMSGSEKAVVCPTCGNWIGVREK